MNHLFMNFTLYPSRIYEINTVLIFVTYHIYYFFCVQSPSPFVLDIVLHYFCIFCIHFLYVCKQDGCGFSVVADFLTYACAGEHEFKTQNTTAVLEVTLCSAPCTFEVSDSEVEFLFSATLCRVPACYSSVGCSLSIMLSCQAWMYPSQL